MNLMKMRPINEHVLVRVEKEESTEVAGVTIHNTKNEQTQEYGEVIDPGDTELSAGDRIYFKSYSSIPIKIDGEDHHFVKYEEIIAVS